MVARADAPEPDAALDASSKLGDANEAVQIVFDCGDALIAGQACKDVPAADRVFHDAIVSVD